MTGIVAMTMIIGQVLMLTGSDVAQILVALAGGGFLASIVQGVLQRRKLGADYAEVIANTATGLLKPLSERVGELEGALEAERRKVKQLRADLDEARASVRMLRNELAKALHEPLPYPRTAEDDL